MLENNSTTHSDLATETNQTQFEVEKPLFERIYKPSKPVAKITTEAAADLSLQKWWQKPKTLIFLVSGCIGLIVILVLLALALSQPKQNSIETKLPEASSLPITNDGFQQRLQEAQTALDQADPAENEFPLPPVDYEFRLFDVDKK